MAAKQRGALKIIGIDLNDKKFEIGILAISFFNDPFEIVYIIGLLDILSLEKNHSLDYNLRRKNIWSHRFCESFQLQREVSEPGLLLYITRIGSCILPFTSYYK